MFVGAQLSEGPAQPFSQADLWAAEQLHSFPFQLFCFGAALFGIIVLVQGPV